MHAFKLHWMYISLTVVQTTQPTTVATDTANPTTTDPPIITGSEPPTTADPTTSTEPSNSTDLPLPRSCKDIPQYSPSGEYWIQNKVSNACSTHKSRHVNKDIVMHGRLLKFNVL